VYFGAHDYTIYALDRIKGKGKWRYKTGGYLTSSPTVAAGIIYFGSMDNFFYALNARSGRLRLKFQSYAPIVSSPAAADGAVYFCNSNGSLYALDGHARNWPGENKLRPFWTLCFVFGMAPRPSSPSGFLWRLKMKSLICTSPLLNKDFLYIGCGNGLFSIDIKRRKKRCLFRTGGMIRSSPVAIDHMIYVASGDNHVYAFNTETGKMVWRVSTGGMITSSPAVVNNTLFIGSHDGNLYAIH
jgi:outer membrane protein assembly factor BamB